MKRLTLLLIAMLGVWGTAAADEPYPSRTVRMVVPWPPGGPPDVMGRLVVQKMSELWGKPVIVDNRPGATGTIGTDSVARAAPDGYAALLTPHQPIVIAPALFKTPYDPARDLAPVAKVGEGTNVLVVSPALKVGSVAELVALAKSKPGSLTFSSAGPGSIAHLSGELFKQIAGVDIVHVPYQGAGAAMTAVINGEVSMGIPPVQQGAPHVRSGKVKGLGVTGTRTSQFLPELQPLVDQGLSGLVSVTWFAVYVPPRTPKPVMQVLREALQRSFADPGIRQKLTAAGIEEAWQEADQVSAAIENELAMWRKLVQTARIKAE